LHWSDHGRQWTCTICGKPNDWSFEAGYRRDGMEPGRCGISGTAWCGPRTLCFGTRRAGVFRGRLETMDQLPGGNGTKIGFISITHYYNLDPTLKTQMLVVADLKELFVPWPNHWCRLMNPYTWWNPF
jgi:Sec23/Sec24 trunk domain